MTDVSAKPLTLRQRLLKEVRFAHNGLTLDGAEKQIGEWADEALSVDTVAQELHKASCLNAASGNPCGHNAYDAKERRAQAEAVVALLRSKIGTEGNHE